MNLESSQINRVFNYSDYLSLNVCPQEYLHLITTCHPIQSLSCSNKEKPRLRSFVQPKITKPARIEWIRFSLIPALFVSFRCIGRGQNAVCPEKLGNWQLTTGNIIPDDRSPASSLRPFSVMWTKNVEQVCCDQSNRNLRHLICKVAFHP